MAVNRNLRRWLPAIVILAIFAVVLVIWTVPGQVSPDHIQANTPRSSGPSGPDSSASSATSPSGSSSHAPGTDAGGFPTNLPLNGSNVVDVRTGAPHRVTIEATSNTSIRRLLFYIRGGTPSTGRYTGVASPVRVSTIGREGASGPIAEVWMQSSIYADVVSCTITVDGTVRSTNTAKGPYNVAICIA